MSGIKLVITRDAVERIVLTFVQAFVAALAVSVAAFNGDYSKKAIAAIIAGAIGAGLSALRTAIAPSASTVIVAQAAKDGDDSKHAADPVGV